MEGQQMYMLHLLLILTEHNMFQMYGIISLAQGIKIYNNQTALIVFLNHGQDNFVYTIIICIWMFRWEEWQVSLQSQDQMVLRSGMWSEVASYRGDDIYGDAFDEKSRLPDPHCMISAYSQSAATLNLLRALATGGYAAMQRVTQWNLDFTEHSEQGDRWVILNQ